MSTVVTTTLLRAQQSGHIPNVLSTFRLMTCWVPAAFVLSDPSPAGRLRAFVSIIVIFFTDWLDGYLARRWGQTSNVGKIIDPLADKALVAASLLSLCILEILAPPWGWAFLAITTAREIVVSAVRKWRFDRHGLVIPANRDGKLKTGLLAVGIAAAYLPAENVLWSYTIWMILAASLWFSVTSASAYLRR